MQTTELKKAKGKVAIPSRKSREISVTSYWQTYATPMNAIKNIATVKSAKDRKRCVFATCVLVTCVGQIILVCFIDGNGDLFSKTTESIHKTETGHSV
jgi:hypothetical protein